MLKKLQGLASDSAAYGLGAVLSKLVGFLLIPLYTRYLEPRDYGVMAMLTVLTVLYQAFAFLGMKSAVFRQYSLARTPLEERRVFTIGMRVVLLSALLMTALALALAAPLTRLLIGDLEALELVRLTLLTALFSTVSNVPIQVLQSARKARLVASLNLASFALTTTLAVVLVVVYHQGVRGVVLASLASSVVFLAVQLAVTARLWVRHPPRALAREMLLYGLPFVPYRLQLVLAGTFGEYMVRRLLGLEEAGLYSIALRFALPLGFVVDAISQAWWAYKFKIFREEEDPALFFRSTVTYFLAMACTLWVGLSLWGPEGVRWLTPAHYHAAAWIVPAAALIPLTQGMYQMLGTGIELGKDARSIPLVGTAGLVAAVVGTLLLVPHFGAVGAALASSLSGGAMILVIHRLAQYRFRIAYDWRVLATLTLLATLFVLTGIGIQGLPTAARLAASAALSVAFPLAALAVLHASPTERGRVRALVRGLRHRPHRPASPPDRGTR